MGLLDQVLGGLEGGAGANSSPIQGILTSMLGGESTAGAGQSGQVAGGGLTGLIAQFEQAGLGHITQSWTGNGPNEPVTPQQLHSVLGDDQVQSMASQAGIQPQDLLVQLSQHLPNVINGMTPTGHGPDAGTVSV